MQCLLDRSASMAAATNELQFVWVQLQAGSTVAKIGPWGGDYGGRDHDVTVAPRRLRSVSLRHGKIIDSIAFTYDGGDGDGELHLSGRGAATAPSSPRRWRGSSPPGSGPPAPRWRSSRSTPASASRRCTARWGRSATGTASSPRSSSSPTAAPSGPSATAPGRPSASPCAATAASSASSSAPAPTWRPSASTSTRASPPRNELN